MKYQNMRGGVVCLDNITATPFQLRDSDRKDDILHAFLFALNLEKSINQHLLDLHGVASSENDPQFSDYLEGEFLEEQVTAISELSKIVSVLNRFNGDQHAIWNYVHTL
jgi:ferritin heavy chain